MTVKQYMIARDGEPQMYTLRDLRRDNPGVSFPRHPALELLAEYGVYPILEADRPQFDQQRERLRETVEFDGKQYVRSWTVEPLSIASMDNSARLASAKRKEDKREALAAHADPLFFKWQRGQATKQEWLDAVQDVEDWYA